MITVEEADEIIRHQCRSFGNEIVPLEMSLGRILAEDIKADRDLPPFNRVTVDGIAIRYGAFKNGTNTFKIKATQSAGDAPEDLENDDECIEIMTGASLPLSADTVIRYEDIEMRAGLAVLNINKITEGQNIHLRGKDKKAGETVASVGTLITPALIAMAASTGEAELRVRKLPTAVIISSGGELVEVEQTPLPYQIRRSNNYMVKSILQQSLINADMIHVPDNQNIIEDKLKYCLDNYDVILLSGGVSMGKFDYVPAALKELNVQKLFHKVQQRPGKPFWFGKHQNGTLVFAFPGNPVSTCMCVYRYFLPWLNLCIGKQETVVKAILNKAVTFNLPLKYFIQVKLKWDANCRLVANPIEGNGSGDFANLTDIDAFMELPLEKDKFEAGETYPIFKF